MSAWLVALLVALFVGTLVEYWGHRFMHRWLLKQRHARHHRDGTGQGWLLEFKDYTLGTLVLLPLGFIHSLEAGLGFLAGGLLYAAFAAYSHQLQHERPEMCFWMVRPVHFLHHEHHMWKHNFGISLDIWDRVFGTYQIGDWNPSSRGQRSFWNLFRIKWI